MTAAYLKTLAFNLSNEVVLVIALTLCQFGTWYMRRYSFAVSKIVEESLCLYVNWENLTYTY